MTKKIRPTRWDTHIKPRLKEIEGWVRDGLIDEQVIHNLGVAKATFYKYRDEHLELAELLKRNKAIVDVEVENALLKKALGYSVEETTRERIYVRDAEGQQILDADGMPMSELAITKKVTKHIAPDTTAQIFWLKNRKPVEWRDKKEVDVSLNKSLEDFFGDD